MTEYVLGFAFGHTRETVALIEKRRPDWQAGKLNGIGGHIEPSDSTPLAAMQREFQEEAGLEVLDWDWFATIKGADWKVYVFRAFDVPLGVMESRTDERVGSYRVQALPVYFNGGTLRNVRWLVPAALDPDVMHLEIRERKAGKG